MNDFSQIDQDQFRQLLEMGYTPEEASHILLQAQRSIVEVCKGLLDALSSEKETDSTEEATDDNDKR